MSVLSKIALSIAMLTIASTACANGEASPTPEILAKGEAVFMGTCFACHGPDGKGLVPGTPNLRGKKSPLKQSHEVLAGRIRDGFQSKGSPMAMPPKGGNPKLTENELDAVIVYMKEAFLKK